MAPKRRSARLASKEPQTSPRSARELTSYAIGKLTSLLERDETPKKGCSLNEIVAPATNSDRMPGAFESDDSLLRTPQTVPPPRPTTSEMHPSKAQQSTAKQPDSGLRLGFTDIKDTENTALKAIETTPSKSTVDIKSPGFDFKWAKKNETNLSNEAQRIMDSVREEAARIKQQMQAERAEQVRQDAENGLISPITGRKIATPRRKGRFSDVHKAEFDKMDSIASHISVAKGKTPVSTGKAITSARSLKRTNSRAGLGHEPSIPDNSITDHTQQPSSAKRARMNPRGNISSAHAPSTSKVSPHAKCNLPSGVSTPTKASLARAVSAKGIRTLVKIPHALATKSTGTVVPPKSEGSKKYFSALARAPSMKSILHKPPPKYSTDPVKIAAGTHVAPPKGSATSDGGSISAQEAVTPARSATIKRVGFALNPQTCNQGDVSPSPSKVQDRVTYPKLSARKSHPALSSHPPAIGDFTFQPPASCPLKFGPSASASTTPTRPTVRRVRPSGISTPIMPIESLPSVPHGMPNKKRRRIDDGEDSEDLENLPPGSLPAKRLKSNTGGVQYPKLSSGKPLSQLDAVEKRKEGLTPKKKPILSLSRLNALARPKRRA